MGALSGRFCDKPAALCTNALPACLCLRQFTLPSRSWYFISCQMVCWSLFYPGSLGDSAAGFYLPAAEWIKVAIIVLLLTLHGKNGIMVCHLLQFKVKLKQKTIDWEWKSFENKILTQQQQHLWQSTASPVLPEEAVLILNICFRWVVILDSFKDLIFGVCSIPGWLK